MKKAIPFIILALGLVVVAVVIFILKPNKNVEDEITSAEESFIELPIDEKPIISLIPSSDGHYLYMKVEKISVDGAKSMDYELLYDVPDGPTQGVPGTVQLSGKDEFEIDFLLGSESSGKYRYDEGVEEGKITLWFRDDRGKLITKLESAFHLQSGTDSLTSLDQQLEINLLDDYEGYFIVADSLGIYKNAPGEIKNGPYFVSYSEANQIDAEIKSDKEVYFYQSPDWEIVEKDAAQLDTGHFIVI